MSKEIIIQNYIGGEFAPPVSGSYIDNYNPSRGEVYSQIPDSDSRDVENAVAAAKEAFEGWSKTPINERSRILHRIADLIEEQLEDLAKAESRDNGKPVKLAMRVDIPRASANFRFFANTIVGFNSESNTNLGHSVNYTLHQPLGIVGCISPWNLPLYLFTWKIAPALATGNCVIAKPSEITPMTAYLLSNICREAGLTGWCTQYCSWTGSQSGAGDR